MNNVASRFALLALALSATCAASFAFAQDSGGAQDSSSSQPPSSGMRQAPDPQKQADRLSQRLGLSSDQSSKLLSILQNKQQQASAVRGDSSLSKEDRRAKMRSLQQDTDSQINAILTPAQQTQYASMKQAQMQHMQNGHGHGGWNGSGNGGASDGSSGSNDGSSTSGGN